MDKKSEITFFNISNCLILLIMWGSYILLILINFLQIRDISNFVQNIDFIGLFAALSAITGILYSNYKSDKRNVSSLENSNKQLIEQLTREKKEKAIFELLKKILDTLNDDLIENDINWVANIDMIKESFEESQKENEHCYSEFNLFVQNNLYYYFNELINNPHLFNYLPPMIRNEIKSFIKEYYGVFFKFYTFILLRFEGSLELCDNFHTKEFEFTIIDEHFRRGLDSYDLGNYLVKDMIESYYFNPKYRDSEYVPVGKETVIVKIDEEDYNKLEFILNKITYLTYEESLNYGFDELSG